MNTLAAIDLLLGLLSRAQLVSDAIRNARAEGRDELSADELDGIVAASDQATADLDAAIAAARAAGR